MGSVSAAYDALARLTTGDSEAPVLYDGIFR